MTTHHLVNKKTLDIKKEKGTSRSTFLQTSANINYNYKLTSYFFGELRLGRAVLLQHLVPLLGIHFLPPLTDHGFALARFLVAVLWMLAHLGPHLFDVGQKRVQWHAGLIGRPLEESRASTKFTKKQHVSQERWRAAYAQTLNAGTHARFRWRHVGPAAGRRQNRI